MAKRATMREVQQVGKLDADEEGSRRNDLFLPSEEDLFLKNFKSFYYCLNAKPDSTTQIFDANVIINREDIIELNDRVIEKLKNHYEDDGYLVTVNAFLKKGKTYEFNNWEEFLNHHWRDNGTVQSIVLKWEINLRLPHYPMPQRHCLMVKMSSSLRPEEVLRLIFSREIEEIGSAQVENSPIVARVDFINQMIGDELLSIVSSWVKSLYKARQSKSKLVLFLKRNRKRVAYALNYSIVIMNALLCVMMIRYEINTIDVEFIGQITTKQFKHVSFMVVIALITLYSVSTLAFRLAQKIFTMLEMYGDHVIFNISNGDKLKQEELKSIDKKKEGSIIKTIALSIIANIVYIVLLGIVGIISDVFGII